jgi:nucleoid-associated protein YgaU
MRVIAANQGNLQSGDPDLIFPGEVIRLPPVSSS